MSSQGQRALLGCLGRQATKVPAGLV